MIDLDVRKAWSQGYRQGHDDGFVAGVRGEERQTFIIPPVPGHFDRRAVESLIGRVVGIALIVCVSVVMLCVMAGAALLGLRILGGLIG